MTRPVTISNRNATFQQWGALLNNRAKRQRAGEFIVQGVRPISIAVEREWPVRALLTPQGTRLSSWASGVMQSRAAERAMRAALAPDLLIELGGKEQVPELVAVVEMPADDLGRIPVSDDMLVVVFDRPTTPGNLGTLIRSADAFGASGVLISGHAADIYDPRTVRASTGSLFALPVVRVGSHADVVRWVRSLPRTGTVMTVVGLDENGDADIFGTDLTGPTILVVGNETHGLSGGWREVCDVLARIPMSGSASSLNAASAGAAALYEVARQRIGGAARGEDLTRCQRLD